MALIFGDQRLDLGDVPNLVPPGGGVGPGEPLAAPPAALRLDGDDGHALVLRDEGPHMLRVSGLAAGPTAAFLLRSRFGVRMLGARGSEELRGDFFSVAISASRTAIRFS